MFADMRYETLGLRFLSLTDLLHYNYEIHSFISAISFYGSPKHVWLLMILKKLNRLFQLFKNITVN